MLRASPNHVRATTSLLEDAITTGIRACFRPANPSSIGSPGFPGILARRPVSAPGQSIGRWTRTSGRNERAHERPARAAPHRLSSFVRWLCQLAGGNMPNSHARTILRADLGDCRAITRRPLSTTRRLPHVQPRRPVPLIAACSTTPGRRPSTAMSHASRCKRVPLREGPDNAPPPDSTPSGAPTPTFGPANIDRRQGSTPFNQTHTFGFSSVLPRRSPVTVLRTDPRHNQLGIILQANRRIPFNMVSTGTEPGRACSTTDHRHRPQQGRLGRSSPSTPVFAFHPVHGRARLDCCRSKNILNTRTSRVQSHCARGCV